MVSSISPTTIPAGSAALTLTVNGAGFTQGSVVSVSGNAETTTFVSATQLTAAVPAGQIASGAQLSVSVANGTATSSGAPVTLEVDNPAPTITSVSPTAEAAGAASAVITVTGTGFVPSTAITVNGSARTTTYTSAKQVTVALTAADLASTGKLSLAAVNATPGGGTSSAASLSVVTPTAAPVLTSLSPDSVYAGSPDLSIFIEGSGFTSNSVAMWNGSPRQTSLTNGPFGPGPQLFVTLTEADLASPGHGSITVQTPEANPSLSNALPFAITNPPVPTVSSVYPAAGGLATPTKVTVNGAGFTTETVVSINGVAVPTSFTNSGSLTANIPASALSLPGNAQLTVSTPAPGGGTTAPTLFTVYLPITANDIVFNPTDNLLYASTPASTAGNVGNSILAIDPNTGAVIGQIFAGSNPNKIALSSDGKQLFVGLDGAASVAQIDLTQGKVVNQFSLGGGQGVYNPPLTALSLAGVPGSPNSVAIATSTTIFNPGTGVIIYDSGVPRTHSFTSGTSPIAFGASASVLYAFSGSQLSQLTVDSTGVSSSTALATLNYAPTTMQYDNGSLYLSTGQVLSAANGSLKGTLYSSANTAVNGPIASDSSLGRAFVVQAPFGSNSDSVYAFDESSFNQLGTIAFTGAGENGYGATFEKIVRWGQNGLAINVAPGPFTSQSQIFLLQSPQVKDVSASPADLSVTLNAPATVSTGTSGTWTATVKNNGPNSAQGAVAALSVDPSLILGSVSTSVGSCTAGATITCDLGTLANGASATITLHATATEAGKLATATTTTASSYDPTLNNNQANATTTASGSTYSAPPSLVSLSPTLVQAGAGDTQLTVNGAGFNAGSTVHLGTTALSTTYVSPTQLTATVPAAQIANYGWAPVTVASPSPGGGTSAVLPLTIYAVVNVPASSLLFDPYAQLLYATVPSTSTTITGNSVVSINPATASVGTPVAVGSEPTVMAETTDGNELYISLGGANSIAQFNLLTGKLTNTIPVSSGPAGFSFGGSFAPSWLAAMPGTDTTLAVSQPGEGGVFGIFDITGNTGTFRSKFSGIYDGDAPVFADATHIYAHDEETTGNEFYRYTIDSSGLTQEDGTTLKGLGGFGGGIQYLNGLVYGTGGGIINPSTTPPSQVATLALIDFYGSGSTPEGTLAVADPSLNKDFLLVANTAGTWAYGLIRYDLSTYLPEAQLDLPSAFNSPLEQWNAFRWGQDGLALLNTSTDPSTSNQTSSLMLLRGPFVAPQELTTQSAATLGSASSLTHGNGNATLTLTGSNFLPGVAVTWNGSYRTTTRVDASHLTIAIPASDLVNAGSASLVATNPGAVASNTLSVTIH